MVNTLWSGANSPLQPSWSSRPFPEGKAQAQVSFLWVAIIEKKKDHQHIVFMSRMMIKFFLTLRS